MATPTATFGISLQEHNPDEIPNRGRNILNNTSIYNSEVTQYAVSADNVVLVPRPRDVVEMEHRSSAAPAHNPPNREVLDTVDRMDTATMMYIPTSREFLDAIETDEFIINDDDIFLVTYAKTGTTWMTEIIEQLLCSCDEHKVIKYKDEIMPAIRIELFAGVGEEVRERIRYVNNMSRRRLLITHIPPYLLPERIMKKAKIIITYRHPKDTATSYFHFSKMNAQMGRFTGDWDTFFKAYITGEVQWGSWIDWHLPSYMRYKECDNVLMVRFEDMKKDAKSVVRKVDKFLNTNCSEQIIETTFENCGFKKMKEKVGPYMENCIFFDYKISHFFRKGSTGDWKNHFTVAQSDMYDAILENVLKHAPEFREYCEL